MPHKYAYIINNKWRRPKPLQSNVDVADVAVVVVVVVDVAVASSWLSLPSCSIAHLTSCPVCCCFSFVA